MMLNQGVFLIAASILIHAASASYYQGYDQMLSMVNQARRAAGVKEVCGSDKLMKSAAGQAAYCVSIGKMDHGGPTPLMSRFTNQGFQPVTVAENLGETPGTDVKTVFDAWMADPPHKANILGPSYTHFGSALAQGKNGQYFWAQHFAQAADSKEPCMSGGSSGGAGSTPSQPPIPKTSTPPSTPATTPANPQPAQPQSPMPSQAPGSSMPSGFGAGSPPSGASLPTPGAPLALNVRAPSQGPQVICIQGVCYQMFDNEFGRGFAPTNYRPPNADGRADPIFV